MEVLKNARRPFRREFDILHEELEGLLKEVPLNESVIKGKFHLFTENLGALAEHDNRILEQVTFDKASVEVENAEFDEIRSYKFRAELLRQEKERLLPPEPIQNTPSVIAGSQASNVSVRNFKLPTVEIKKFTGELEDWLGFWAQFRKINEDPVMSGSDKMWYLLQSLEPNSEVYKMVARYPLTNENYDEVIEVLKKRYGDEDLQLQVYIRKLLSLVISNVNSKDKMPLNDLFLELDSHLRALKTLNLKNADPATWLFPLVESSLPGKILYNWQSSPLSSMDGSTENPPKSRLDFLMTFIEREVSINRKIDLAHKFAHDQSGNKKELKAANRNMKQEKHRSSVTTLSSFHAGDDKKSCVFCDRSNHISKNCFRAKSMSYEKKMNVLKEKRLCYLCCGKHIASECDQRSKLECAVCKKQHLTILCKEAKGRGETDSPSSKKRRLEAEVATTTTNCNVACSEEIALQIVMVKIMKEGKEEIVRAFLDSGSQRSYIKKQTAQELKLQPCGVERVVHSLFGDQRTKAMTHNKYQLKIKSLSSDFEKNIEVREIDKLCGGLPKFAENHPELKKELKTKNIELSDWSRRGISNEIQILIGADLYGSLLTGQVVELTSGAVAVQTKLGWTLMGTVANCDSEENLANMCLSMSISDASITQLWEMEAIGIKSEEMTATVKKQEEIAMENFMKNISRGEDGRYVVKLPWRENVPYLPPNREVAFKRLQAATKKLLENGLFEAYNEIFKTWEEMEFIEKVPVSTGVEKIHYVPHRPVVKNSLTTPVRPVFDASCRNGKQPSLNDCLLKGGNYILKIPEILLRFREKRIGFVADVKKAFQMIGVDQADRDVMRFLWWADGSMQEVVEFRHARVMFGATCSPFLLGAVITTHLTNLADNDVEVGKKLLSTLYVDNCVSSEETLAEYEAFREKSVSLMKDAAMELRMWMSNVDGFEDEATHTISVLGIIWDRWKDELFVNVRGISTPSKITKRNILSTVQKIFDPIGLTCPALVPMKVLLQKTWMTKTKWDEELPQPESRLFLNWCDEIKCLGEICIPRLSTGGICDRRKWSLHIFMDASKEAYAAVIFLRVEHEGVVSVQLLASKARIAPVKELSIPKKELMGCLIGARLLVAVKIAMSIEDVPETFYTDSSTCLAWIRRSDEWGTFVANRVNEIRKLTRVDDWRHIAGSLNPADLPSRGCSPSALLKSKWWEGPTWLYENMEEWPRSEEIINEDEVVAEKKKSAPTNAVTFTFTDNIRKSHSFAGMVRIIGWVRRFLFNKLVKNPERRRKGRLSKEELRRAELIYLREIQREAFPMEKRADLKGLETFEDDWRIFRVKTRLTYRDVPSAFKYPVLLPSKGDEVETLIKDTHRSYCHVGTGTLIVKLRSKYWILKCRQAVKRVLSKCHRCRRFSSKKIIPDPAPLPLDRIKDAEVFEVVGIDLAGPLTLRNGAKAWIVLFTCGVYRAVHFELVKNISTRAFIAVLEKFVEKFRRPDIIYTDNGTNFRGAFNLFKKINWSIVENEEKCSKITWKFSPVISAWWGGWWERLVRTAKDLLRRTVGKGTLNWSELKTVLGTVEDVMNSRPLTYVSEDPEDLEPLTPALFLHPFGSVQFPEGELTESQKMRFRVKYVKTMKQELRSRFLKEYLASLVNRNGSKATRPLRVGELVIVGNDAQKRIDWPLGKILELIPGHDGVVRLAKVKTQNGDITRTVQRLFPLEMEVEEEYEKSIREKAVKTRSGRSVKQPVRFQQ